MARRMFELACELTVFPEAARLEALQKELAQVTDAQAEELAARPLPRTATVAALTPSLTRGTRRNPAPTIEKAAFA